MVFTGVSYKSRACNTQTSKRPATADYTEDLCTQHHYSFLHTTANQWTEQEDPMPGVCILWANHVTKSWGFQSSVECVVDSYRKKMKPPLPHGPDKTKEA